VTDHIALRGGVHFWRCQAGQAATVACRGVLRL